MAAGNKISKSKLNNKIKELPVPVQEHCTRCKLIANFLVERIKAEDWFCDANLNPEHILSAVYFHDIGKADLPIDNIYAEHNITTSKQTVYRSHVEVGISLIDSLCNIKLAEFDKPKLESYVYEAITEHHEAADGCGFPKRLTSKTMSVTGKITAIANTVDNLFFLNPVEAKDFEELTKHLAKMSGVELDEELLGVMLSDEAAFLSFIKYVDARYKNKRKTDNYGFQIRFNEIRNIIENETREYYTEFVINDPFYGIVKREVYMPVADMTARTARLTLIMAERLCLALDRIRERGGRPMPVSMFVEASCFGTKKFVPEMVKLLIKYDIKENLICLVVDEKGLIELEGEMGFIDNFASLKNGGYRMAIKMMSEGASLISSLDTIPIDYIYIDSSYTKRFALNSNTYGVASGILDIAHNLHLSVVFMGVDAHGIEKSLLKMRARLAAGEIYGSPMNEKEYVSLMAHGGDDSE